jgi:hypothetical protein
MLLALYLVVLSSGWHPINLMTHSLTNMLFCLGAGQAISADWIDIFLLFLTDFTCDISLTVFVLITKKYVRYSVWLIVILGNKLIKLQ